MEALVQQRKSLVLTYLLVLNQGKDKILSLS